MASGQRGIAALSRAVPVVLLIVLAMAGLRGAAGRPGWSGPLHASGVAVGVALAVVLAALLVVTLARRRSALAAAAAADPAGTEAPTVAAKLRGVLLFVLGAGLAADVVGVLYALHLHGFTSTQHAVPSSGRLPSFKPRKGALLPYGSPADLKDWLYGLLILMLVAAVVLSIRWVSRLRLADRLGEDEPIAEDPADLREAVESGRAALRTFDDAKTAIIACYVAMEQRLAERGAARGVADTPDELLARATRSKVIRGAAPGRLTALFYEARFSSHPMDQGQRAAAEQALDELAAALRQAERQAERAERAGRAEEVPT
jgi:hypothetical protein